MSYLKQTILKIKALFPGISYWSSLPAFVSWIAVSCGIVLSKKLSHLLQLPATIQSSLYNVLLIAAILSGVAGIFIKFRSGRFGLFLLCGILISIYNSNKDNILYSIITISSSKEIQIYGKVTSPPLPYPDKVEFLFTIDSASVPALKGFVFQCISKEMVKQSTRCILDGRIVLPLRKENPYQFDEFEYLRQNGIVARFTVEKNTPIHGNLTFIDKLSVNFRTGISSVINKFTSAESRALLYAAFLGETEYLSQSLKTSFRDSGIFHLLSISGLHAAMLIGACYFLLLFVPIPMQYKHCLALIVIWAYQLFIGFIPCLFRATLMSTLIIVTFLFQKKSYPIHSIGLAGTLWLIISPLSLFQPGYQLSFAATLGILLLYPSLNKYQISSQNPVLNFFTNKLLSSVYLSMVGIMSTLPVLLYHFGNVSIIGILTNIIAVPIMTFAMWIFFGAIIINSAFGFLAPIMLCDYMLQILVWISDLMASVPFASVYQSAWPIGINLLFMALTLLIASIDKKHFLYAIAVCIPLFLIMFSATKLIQATTSKTSVRVFSVKEGALGAVKWRDGTIDLIIHYESIKGGRQNARIASSWTHHQWTGRLRSVILISDKKLTTLPQNLQCKNVLTLDSHNKSSDHKVDYTLTAQTDSTKSFTISGSAETLSIGLSAGKEFKRIRLDNVPEKQDTQ
jgi:ComEC/Rec2-related protein